MIAALMPVLLASNGRAFLLFASHRALREAAETLRDAPWPLFVQGEAPRATLLQKFRESGNGVLLGAASFREGVDVVGDAPVSYTHLDVYKRQTLTQQLARSGLLGIGKEVTVTRKFNEILYACLLYTSRCV